MQSEMVGAKGVAQSVRFARHFRCLAERGEMLLECDFVAGPEFARLPLSEGIEPTRKSSVHFHQAALAGFRLACRDFDMAAHAPNVSPIKPEQFGSAKASQPTNGNQGPERIVCRFQQGAEFLRRV